MKSILQKANREQGLLPEEAFRILEEATPADWEQIYGLARQITKKHFHKEIRFFAPLYFSDVCVNECDYCGYKRSNIFKRKRLTPEAFLDEARYLWDQGHRSILLVAAEHPVFSGSLRVANYMMQLKTSGLDFSIAIEVGAYQQFEYRDLAAMGVNRCILYQETYNRQLYAKLHQGPKEDFDYRYHSMGRAMAAGIPSTGLGFLLGLSDYKTEVSELIRHAQLLHYNTGKHVGTFSLPRIQPATGIEDFVATVQPVADETFERILALLKVAVPKTGIVLTTRESPAFRNHLLKLGIGVTHMSAGVHTETGGYTQSGVSADEGQFSIQDYRPLAEVVEAAKGLGYRPCQTALCANTTAV
ncbi:2-iminoacetate synthase ThiH [Omnitrophica bacterium]|nr:2-iminoacetate synthase ThiH [Candidatus Omnitrophota bacterium]